MTKLCRSFTAEIKIEAAFQVFDKGYFPLSQPFIECRLNRISPLGSAASIRTQWHNPNQQSANS